ncbi:SDR family oxidoreductase [Actinomadura livida]|uniref:SDR family oxidoreductase n=1 Tax=Actinomadura livida TaxID=79909 RepID=A0A7W7I7W3_9ACTN|nr:MULTISPECIES: SDR family oxidoreductase [Actinomadura]MBB4772152.1 short-subunit dehydrogenase [Actinomadura catellatispora]GGU37661.1 short chain dehydrogenase [Actinomadura livida]
MGTYVITGATGGIGTAVAELLRERGHDLVLTGRSPERLAKLEAALRGGANAPTQVINPGAVPPASRSAAITTIPLDLREPRRIEASLAMAGMPARLDGVVHAAGMVHLGRVADTEADEWIEHISVNLVSAAELTRLLLPALRAAEGHVVFVNSTAGLRANPQWSAYAASKFGLRALADSLRAEEPSLRVTTVYPGRTATEMQRKVRAQEGGTYAEDDFAAPATVARVLVAALETPRDAVVADVTVRPT